jgi:ankyrin repeat protein
MSGSWIATCVLFALAMQVAALSAAAQVPPSAAELKSYRGLFAAVASGDEAQTRRSLRDGGDPNARDGNGRSILHIAAFQGHPGLVGILLEAGADPSTLDDQRYDAVTVAAVRDDVPMLRALLAAGASTKLVTSPYDGTALIAAAHLGHDQGVRELIAAGAPLDHINNLGWTALIEAVILGAGGTRHVETVRTLVEAGANPSLADRSGVTPLQHARSSGYSAIASILERTVPR